MRPTWSQFVFVVAAAMCVLFVLHAVFLLIWAFVMRLVYGASSVSEWLDFGPWRIAKVIEAWCRLVL